MEPDAATAMTGHVIVYLRAAPAVLAARRASATTAADDHRPEVGSITQQFDARDGRYRELASIVVETTEKAPDAIVAEISAALAE
jgi:shikimate kinase